MTNAHARIKTRAARPATVGAKDDETIDGGKETKDGSGPRRCAHPGTRRERCSQQRDTAKGVEEASVFDFNFRLYWLHLSSEFLQFNDSISERIVDGDFLT